MRLLACLQVRSLRCHSQGRLQVAGRSLSVVQGHNLCQTTGTLILSVACVARLYHLFCDPTNSSDTYQACCKSGRYRWMIGNLYYLAVKGWIVVDLSLVIDGKVFSTQQQNARRVGSGACGFLERVSNKHSYPRNVSNRQPCMILQLRSCVSRGTVSQQCRRSAVE